MNARYGLLLTFGLTACATAGGARIDSLPPAGAGCPPLASATASRGANEARAHLEQGRSQEARAALRIDDGHPLDHLLAGRIYIATGDYAQADQALERAETLCPAWKPALRLEREKAWRTLFEAGLDAHQARDVAKAKTLWRQAGVIYQGRPDAAYNLAVLAASEEDLPEAERLFRAALTTLEAMPADLPAAERVALEEIRRNISAGLLNLSARRFMAAEYQATADLLLFLSRLEPNNRDAWYNHALALYKLERWTDLAGVAQKLVEIDPLNENARILLYNAYKGLDQRAEALSTLEAVEGLPVYVEGIQLEPGPGTTTVRGQVVGNRAAAGAPMTLELTLVSPGGDLGSSPIRLTAPARGERAPLEIRLEHPSVASSYRYRLVP